MEPSSVYRLAGLLAAKIICCGALVLAASGAISFAGLPVGFSAAANFWLAAVVLAVIGIVLWRRNARLDDDDVRKGSVSLPVFGRRK